MSESPVETDIESIEADSADLNDYSDEDRLDVRIPGELVLLKKVF